nr:response regulator transcription factor [Roseibium sp. CAU 1639]
MAVLQILQRFPGVGSEPHCARDINDLGRRIEHQRLLCLRTAGEHGEEKAQADQKICYDCFHAVPFIRLVELIVQEPRFHAVIADDHAIVRAGLRIALETPGTVVSEGIAVVAEANDGLQAIAAVRRHRPSLLLLDVQMPLAGGLEVFVEARRWSPDTRVVILTGVSSVGKIGELVASGVDGLFSKSEDHDELIAKLPNILSGQRHIAGRFEEMLRDAPAPPLLSDRERQTLNLIVSGRSNREIGETLGISAKTVDRHRTNLMKKLDVHSVAQLIAYALREGLIDPSVEL